MGSGRIRAAVLVTAGMGALSACGGSNAHRYPAESESNFLSNCKTSALNAGASQDRANSFCQCVLTGLEKNVSYADFKRIDTRMTLGDRHLPSSFIDAVSNCR